MPGYTGHIKGLISENLFAASYGNCTANAIGKKHPIGYNIEPKQRFLSQNSSQYKSKNFRRFGKLQTTTRRDLEGTRGCYGISGKLEGGELGVGGGGWGWRVNAGGLEKGVGLEREKMVVVDFDLFLLFDKLERKVSV